MVVGSVLASAQTWQIFICLMLAGRELRIVAFDFSRAPVIELSLKYENSIEEDLQALHTPEIHGIAIVRLNI